MKRLLPSLLFLLGGLAFAQTAPDPATAPLTEMQKWIATLETTWQETFVREVTAPQEAELTRLGQQYLAALEANIVKASKEGNLETTLIWRGERDQFAKDKSVPSEDDATVSAPLKQLRDSWRAQAARIEKGRAGRATGVVARYDQLLAQAQKQLTQQHRFDDALLLKTKREEVSARWMPAAPPLAAVAATAPEPKPLAAVGVKGTATPAAKGAKFNPREVMEKLLAAGVQVRIGEYRSQKDIRQIEEAPEKFAFYNLTFRPRKDNVPVTDEDLALLDNIPSLPSLVLENIDVTDAGLDHLRSLRTLQYLELNNLPKVAGPGYKVLGEHPTMEMLKLFSIPAGEAAIKAAAASKRLPHILMGAMEVPESALVALSANTTISVVDFEKGVTGLTPASLAHLAKMKKLNGLHFVEFPITDAIAAEIGKMESLQQLSIRVSELTEAGIVSLGKLRNMTDLALTAPPTTPAALAALKKMKLLRSLTVTRATPAEDLTKLRVALKGVNVKE